MENALRGAELKLKRAEQQLVELRTTVNAFVATQPFEVLQARDVAAERIALIFKQRAEIDPTISLLIGEMAGSLRSALDYLVYALILRATGKAPRTNKTQFPIFESEAGYNLKEGLMLCDVPQVAKDAIRACQPFATGEGAENPLWHLRTLSNRDKHHDIVIAAAAMLDPAFQLHPEYAEIYVHKSNKPLVSGNSIFSASLIPSSIPFLEREAQIPLNMKASVYLTFAVPVTLQGLEIPKALAFIGKRVTDVLATVRGVAGL